MGRSPRVYDHRGSREVRRCKPPIYEIELRDSRGCWRKRFTEEACTAENIGFKVGILEAMLRIRGPDGRLRRSRLTTRSAKRGGISISRTRSRPAPRPNETATAVIISPWSRAWALEQLDLLRWNAPRRAQKPVVYPLCPTRGRCHGWICPAKGCGRLELRCGCAARPGRSMKVFGRWSARDASGRSASAHHRWIGPASPLLLPRSRRADSRAGGPRRGNRSMRYWATRAIFQILGTIRPSHVAVVVDHPDGDEARRALHPGATGERKDKDPGFAARSSSRSARRGERSGFACTKSQAARETT